MGILDIDNTYSGEMNRIDKNELYEKLLKHGLFCEKLPPIFDMGSFYDYVIKNPNTLTNSKATEYAIYEVTRNNNIPRIIGIPAPMTYEKLCACIRDNWDKIQTHFQDKTKDWKYKISRIHIRQLTHNNSLFNMNYDRGDIDSGPEKQISLGKEYVAYTDIVQFFPSIYTHSLCWALVGKQHAKTTKTQRGAWYNQLDENTMNTTYGETHGLLVGPHASNILSEIILCEIDKKLHNNYDYVRFIDDYKCYVDSEKDGEEFFLSLNRELRQYGLTLNISKTKIKKFPDVEKDNWVNNIKQFKTIFKHDMLTENDLKTYFNLVLNLLKTHDNDASIINYAIKQLSSYKLSLSAQKFLLDKSIALALLYPYIVPFLEKDVYEICRFFSAELKQHLNLLYTTYLEKDKHDAIAYTLYLATKYHITINKFNLKIIIKHNDCITLLCAYLYCLDHNLTSEIKELKKYARELIKNKEFENYWPFTFECLPASDLKGDWKILKNNGISFLKKSL